MNGIEKWETQEKILPSLASRPAVPTLTSQFNKMMQSQAQASAQGSVMSTASVSDVCRVPCAGVSQ
jgi:hypothetical protein